MIVRVNRKNGFELFDCHMVTMTMVGKKGANLADEEVDVVEFRLTRFSGDVGHEIANVQIDESCPVFIMNDAGQTITQYRL